MAGLTVREANKSDAAQVFEWRNDPWIVSLSAGRKTVTWQEHSNWFNSVIASEDHLVFILEIEGEGAGTVRLDRASASTAILNVYLLKDFTGRGFGVEAIKRATAACFDKWSDIEAVEAYVRAENNASLSAFSKAGFSRAPDENKDGGDEGDMLCLRFVRRGRE